MAQQTINVGTVAEDHTGDPARTAGQKINANLTELYARANGVYTVAAGGRGRFSTLQSAVLEALSNPQFVFGAVTGTVSVSLDGKTVTGVGTNFLTAFSVSKYIDFDGNGKLYAVKSVASDTTLRLVSPAKEAHSGVSARSAKPVMRVIHILESIEENVYINTTGLSGGGQLDNVALAFNWHEGAQHSGVIEHYSRSGVIQFNGLQQLDVAEARLGGKVGPIDVWPMMDMAYTRIRRRSVDGVDFIYNTNTQRVYMNDSFIEGNFDILMPFCSGEVLIQNSTLRSMPNDEADPTIANQALNAIFTADNGIFIANNSTFWVGCYGAGVSYPVNLTALDGATVKTGCVFNFNHSTLIGEKVAGSTEVGSASFAFVNLEADGATINIEGGTNFQFIGSPTPGGTWRNFRSEPTVSVPATVNIKDSRIMQGLGYATPYFTLNHVDNNNVQTVAYAASITPNANLGSRINIGTMTGNPSIGAPTNPQIGQRITFGYVSDATPGRTPAYNAVFKTSTVPGSTANARATHSFQYDGTNWVQFGGPLVWL